MSYSQCPWPSILLYSILRAEMGEGIACVFQATLSYKWSVSMIKINLNDVAFKWQY